MERLQLTTGAQGAPVVAGLKDYFQKIQQLAATGEQFPVDLDEVWPLVYSQKEKAVRALRKTFFEGQDFEVLTRNGENPKGGRPEQSYRLSTSCLEYFIARKVREVFDVYRAVFHQATTAIQAPAIDPALLQILQQQSQLMSGQQSQIDQLRSEIDSIRSGNRVKKQLPRQLPIPLVDNRQTRQVISRRIAEYCGLRNCQQREVYHYLYQRMQSVYGLNVWQLTRHPGESVIDAVERYGYLDRVLALISAELAIPNS
ncbi:hypothetical protein [Fibrivirga algicola]|uniref:AntA/AntB antirepressor domain-containing protein n=1 Tax=Fibrivirga algicola TaxID=2950420 RepID=A0ABX0QEU5_9BACT|nr:hypothetical protein [Fibrivirga algicola]NID09388.1 hypothetical protein [Fibrivirga algicola]